MSELLPQEGVEILEGLAQLERDKMNSPDFEQNARIAHMITAAVYQTGATMLTALLLESAHRAKLDAMR